MHLSGQRNKHLMAPKWKLVRYSGENCQSFWRAHLHSSWVIRSIPLCTSYICFLNHMSQLLILNAFMACPFVKAKFAGVNKCWESGQIDKGVVPVMTSWGLGDGISLYTYPRAFPNSLCSPDCSWNHRKSPALSSLRDWLVRLTFHPLLPKEVENIKMHPFTGVL